MPLGPLSSIDTTVSMRMPRVCVLMPTWNHAAFIERALDSLLAQSFTDWELIIVDDASPDNTAAVVAHRLIDDRIRYQRLNDNVGLGAALNIALDASRAPLVAYLPSDDVWYREHLEHLVAALDAAPRAALAIAGVRYRYNRHAHARIDGKPLQLVQCLHRRVPEHWIERGELVTDDLDRMYWNRVLAHGDAVETGIVSCEWVEHPDQLHRVLQEPEGGINTYRARFHVRHPLRFHATTGNYIDEVTQYAKARSRPDTPMASDGLKVLLVGELAYNADRVLALEELGHRLYGLWMDKPYWYNTVGPVPFGHVTDLPRDDWQRAVRKLAPDVIYAGLNWQAVPFAHEVRNTFPDIPFVWHFKEGPFICLEKGTWPRLMDLYRTADAQIFVSDEMRDWFDTVVPGSALSKPTLVLDGDLPKRDAFDTPFATRRLSHDDGELHTVVPGRPIGLHPPDVAALAAQGVHLHFYGDFTHAQWRGWIDKARALAPKHLHLHPHVDASRWVEEFSRYDAGWLHSFESRNHGDLRRADWDDLNLPARLSTLAAAGLPMLQRDNSEHRVATQSEGRAMGTSVFFDSVEEVGALLRDSVTERARDAVRTQRAYWTFDAHAARLIAFFRVAIAHAQACERLGTPRVA
ncbi:MAG TPA: glycosyltransferase family A protein [Burkholderiaceae bacterium]|nr:glycosyltransferase family A protein [Burkholderiaceae bacterium]